MAEAFYQQLDQQRFVPTAHAAGPWVPENQHLGPPAALLVRAIEGCDAGFDGLLARFTVEILGPVPLDAELLVRAWIQRPGRSVELAAAEIAVGDRAVASARAWRIATSDSSAVTAGQAEPLPPPDHGQPIARPESWGAGYIDAMEWRSLRGGFADQGPATVWARQRVPLVEGEEPSPLQRLLTVADSGNGVSGTFDPKQWWFINPELTVHVQREPVGEWIALDAVTTIGSDGVGTARSTMHDGAGQVANGSQALLVRRR